MSYQYPYIEHYSPSPAATSTPQQPFAQWADVQDDTTSLSVVSPVQLQQVSDVPAEQEQNQQQQQQQVTSPTYEAPQVIQLTERPLRRPKQQQAQSQTQNQSQAQASTSTSSSSSQRTSPHAVGGVWFDLRDAQNAKSSSLNTGKDNTQQQQQQAVRHPTLANRAQVRLSTHPYYRRAISGEKVRRERERESAAVTVPTTLIPTAPTAAASYTVMACGGPMPTPTSTAEKASTSPSPLSSPLISAGAPVEVRRLLIRTDVHFDAESNSMTVMLELPGVKKTDLSLQLGTCPYSRVKQLTVRGRSSPVFADDGYTVRERKYGEFKRVLVVPPETKPSDIKTTMEDGILFLKFPAAPQQSESQEYANIPIL